MKWLAEYFNMTKGEKRGFTVLIGLVVLLMGLPYLYSFFPGKKKASFGDFSEAVIRYETGVAAMDTVVSESSEKTESIEYFAFDPNKLDVEGWLKLGLDEKTAHIIDNYREAGGEFREKADLKEIYGLEDSTYQRLNAYIELPDKNQDNSKQSSNLSKSQQSNEKTSKAFKEKKSARENPDKAGSVKTVELNGADTAALKRVYGIGPVFSKRMIKYRKLLGGFHDKSQLLEVYGLDSSHYKNIASQVKVDQGQVRKLSLNSAPFQTLQDHPYLEYSDVLAIVNYRDEVDSIKTTEELLEQRIIGQALFERIAPYIKP